MDRALDGLSLLFGRRLPAPLNWLAAAAWWLVFLIAMLSLWPDGYERFGELLESVGANGTPPPANIIVPVMMVLTVIQMAHRLAVKRRSLLLQKAALDSHGSAPGEHPASKRDVPWLLQKNRHIWLVVALAGVGFVWVIIQSEASKAKCGAYEAAHRVRPDQVIDCPYD